MMMINFNTDIGDAWEHAAEGFYPRELSDMAYRHGNQRCGLCVNTLARLKLSKNTHEGFHVIIIVHVRVGTLIDVLRADVKKQLFFVGDKALFHLR